MRSVNAPGNKAHSVQRALLTAGDRGRHIRVIALRERATGGNSVLIRVIAVGMGSKRVKAKCTRRIGVGSGAWFVVVVEVIRNPGHVKYYRC